MSTSSNIWIRCAGDSEIEPLLLDPWRVVESQHQISTRKLVDSDAEQQLLEQLIDEVKPRVRGRARQLHYLLFTPFRYPPLRHGSRFGTRFEPGIWYGSETRRAAFAEVAYYRLLFIEGTAADLGLLELELTAFRIVVRTEKGVDLTRPPFDAFTSQLASPTSYAATQELGTALRGAGVELVRYHSARDVRGGINVGVLAPAAFGRRAPRWFERWYCAATPEIVEMRKRDYLKRDVHVFPREDFLVDGRLPGPAYRGLYRLRCGAARAGVAGECVASTPPRLCGALGRALHYPRYRPRDALLPSVPPSAIYRRSRSV